ncbi:hypothetical protein JI743_10865 [Sphingopyxis sp. DHUNG17]|uniref:hypothetical protein n=1 Tax=Sphingopyxis jiangsuensis TaxID=2871171 RepID=UPI00191D3D6E|nr:hypothetical protein [Sphingopyxis lutea]MBL0769311.1 hypothetical protein [Sphingopyxis lutea]
MAQIDLPLAPAKQWNRLSTAPRPVAALLLAILAALMLLGVAGGHKTVNPNLDAPRIARAEGMIGDHALYVKIVRRMEAGTPYYEAAAAEHRANGYPLRPFAVMRLPTLATILAAIGLPAGIALASLLALATLWAWRRRLTSDPALPPYGRFAVLLIAVNLGQVMSGQWVLMHEVVAGVLVALALAIHRPERPWGAMAIVAAALAIRETILPVAALFGLFALIDRNWRAALGWSAIGVAFFAGLALHASAVAEVARASDSAGGGWLALGGWNNYLSFVHKTSILRFIAPYWLTALLVPLALLGWLAWRGRLGTFGLLFHLGYATAFMVFARVDNDYWGMLVVPTLFAGLVFAPTAVVALWRALAPPRLVARTAA